MKRGRIEDGIEIVDIGAKGKVVGKKDGQTYFCTGAVPGDTVTLELRRKRKGALEGIVREVTDLSPFRAQPECAHFDHCGGCNWQNFQYEQQLAVKERRVKEQLRRLAGLTDFEALPIKGSEAIYHYRNKLEFTFIENRWLTPEEIQSGEEIPERRGLGFHVPGRFDWVLHVYQCHLQDDQHNAMRQFLFDRGRELGLTFDHPREKRGTLRNVVFRNNRQNQWMVLLIVREQSETVKQLCDELVQTFPIIHSLWLIHNEKVNDSFSDCPARLIHGADHILETFTRPDGSTADYIIGPKSFFQTNSDQAENLYRIVYDWAGLDGSQTVYDLYTGTGSIALFVADKAKHVVGIEYVPEAIEDAKKNATLNENTNTSFFAGDMKDVLTADFMGKHGKPEVLITDPPRAGMHGDVVARILEAEPKRIVYVSCDPATQARDIGMLSTKYRLVRIQPVDMFPHTSHVENVALLELA